MPLRYVSAVVAVIVIAAAISVGPAPSGEAAQGAVASTSADVPACGLRLPPPTRGEPHFAIPRGGRATLRALAGGFRLCRLLRADGSRFAQAEIDRLRQVLALRFFRRSGTLLFASDAQFPAKTTAEGADVGCNNDDIRHHRPAQLAAAAQMVGRQDAQQPRCRQGRPGAPLGLFGVGEQHELVRSGRQRESPVGLPGPHGAQGQAGRNERRPLG